MSNTQSRLAKSAIWILALTVIADLEAQVTIPTRSVTLQERRCSKCTATLAAAGRFGASDGDGSLRGNVRLAVRDGLGRVFLTDENGGAPQVFDSTGRFLRMLGRVGAGPGEFRSAAGIVPLRNGRIGVFDSELRRFSTFDRELKFEASRPTNLQAYEVQPWHGDTIIVAARLATPSGFGFPLHLTTEKSEGPKSFSFEPLDALPRGQVDRYFVSVVGKYMCVARGRRIAVVCSTSATASPTEFKFSPPWFKEGVRPMVSDSTLPVATVRAMVPLGPSRVAVAVLVPDAQWRNSIVKRSGPDGVSFEIADYNDYYDTMILVIDLESAAIVASGRVPQAILYSAGHGIFGSLDSDDSYVALWRVLTPN